MKIPEFITQNDHSLRLLLKPSSGQHLSDIPQQLTSISILSGPEGGFSETEIQKAIQHGYMAIQLGPRTLRTETAAVAAISACQTLWGDMG